jgi:hypothetical protein
MIEVSVIVKPKTRAAIPGIRGVHISRQEFSAVHGADNAVVEKIEQLANQYDLKVTEVSLERRTVKLEGAAANMMRAFEVKLDRYEPAVLNGRGTQVAIFQRNELCFVEVWRSSSRF